jgi:hypothetical protein
MRISRHHGRASPGDLPLPSHVLELDDAQRVVRHAEGLATGPEGLFEEMPESLFIIPGKDELILRGPAVGDDRRPLEPDESRASAAVPLVTAQGQGTGSPPGIRVPAFHGMDDQAVGDFLAADEDRPGETGEVTAEPDRKPPGPDEGLCLFKVPET